MMTRKIKYFDYLSHKNGLINFLTLIQDVFWTWPNGYLCNYDIYHEILPPSENYVITNHLQDKFFKKYRSPFLITSMNLFKHKEN